jgi:hypothetical protein
MPRKRRQTADSVSRAWAEYDAEAARQAARLLVRARPAPPASASPLPRRPAPGPAPEPERPRTVTPEMIRQARQSWRSR